MIRTPGLSLILFFVMLPAFSFGEAPAQKEVLDAIRKASDFMMNTASNRGGFVWKYSADLSEQWGEVPAQKSMIWDRTRQR